MISFRNVCGGVLAILMTFSAMLAIMGIWGMVQGDAVVKLMGTFLVVGGATIGISYVADTFFGRLPPVKTDENK